MALLLAALAALLFSRRPDAFLRPQFWAEDFMFLIAAEQHGLASVSLPQAGYLHTLPRLIALTATRLDPVLQPACYLVAALTVTLAVCSSLLSARLELPLKFPLTLAIVVVPHTGEVLFNPTNLQWIVAFGILGTVLKRDPATISNWCLDLLLLVLGGLTGPMMLLAWPILLVRAWRRRTRASLALFLIGTVTAATQLSFIAGLSAESTEPFNLVNLATTVALHLFCSTFLGFLVSSAPSKIAAIAVAAVVAAFVSVVIAASGRHRPALLSMLSYAVVLIMAAAVLKRLDAWDYGDLHGDRYFYVPRTLLLWILLVGSVTASRRWVRSGAFGLLALSVICNAPRFRFVPHPDFGWYAACSRIRAGEAVLVTIDPGWKFFYRRGGPESRFLSRREVEQFERR